MKVSNLWRKNKKKKPSPYGFFGGYGSWTDALKDSTSYTASAIISGNLSRREAFLAQFDSQDSFLDERTQQLLAALAYVLSQTPIKSLKVLDFGGSWGLYSHLLSRALPHIEIDWTVIETEEMVQALQAFATPHLRWHASLPKISESDKPFDLCLASGALPYVSQPYEVLKTLAELGRFVIVTRTGFINEAEDKIAVQRVPPEVFVGSYPAWFFSQKKFVAFMQKLGQVRLTWDVPQDAHDLDGKKTAFRGYLLECL